MAACRQGTSIKRNIHRSCQMQINHHRFIFLLLLDALIRCILPEHQDADAPDTFCQHPLMVAVNKIFIHRLRCCDQAVKSIKNRNHSVMSSSANPAAMCNMIGYWHHTVICLSACNVVYCGTHVGNVPSCSQQSTFYLLLRTLLLYNVLLSQKIQ